VWSMTGVKS